MTVRDKAGLKAQITALIDSAGDPRISAMDLRAVLDDMADSFDFEAMAVGQALISRIDTALGQVVWKQGSGVNTGITLADALAAVMIDAAPVDHHRLTRIETATDVTIGLESTSVHTLTRYAAPSADDIFTESEWLAGATSMNNMIQFPATSSQHYKGFAIPASEASLVTIQQVGNPFDERDSFEPLVSQADRLIDISGEAHKTYIGQSPDFGGFAVDYVLR